ncbi:uncharacterized protein LTR77_002400 [Saxophila tyrrhenica]|uniref:GED domain-containing protein n=1 Tax=Saxophila tyrrhenica TaxID=1690608 RepID=A0AAV9PJ31_9PEZI|nr:hypothetical protein LTR77_002400 [Saxophila tyrrhenica]
MRLHGATFKIGHTSPSIADADHESLSDPSNAASTDPYARLHRDQQVMSEADVTGFVMEVFSRSQLLVETLLTELDLPKHKRSIESFIEDALAYLNADEQMHREISGRIAVSLTTCKTPGTKRPGVFFERPWKEASLEEYNKKLHISNTTVDTEKLLGALQRRVLVDMDEQACSEAWSDLIAYYKVAPKTFVDNVCVQVVERHLLRNLADVFSPEMVIGLSEDELHHIGGERETTQYRRKELQSLHASLGDGLRDLQGM